MIDLDNLIVFAKKKGFIFPSSDIYGGFGGVYDYGPLGVELKNNIKNEWWNSMVRMREDIVGLDSGIFMNPKVWESSGHTEGFSDPFVVCKKTGAKFRLDHLLESVGVDADEKMSIEELKKLFDENKDKIKIEGYKTEDLSDPQFQNLLVSSNMGSKDGEESYLRGETCQGIYVNFKNVLDSVPVKLPFGIAQIGKAFRNEISPRQFLFRTREFEQMEMQYFVKEEEAEKYFKEFREYRLKCLADIGIKKENLRVTKHERLVFYAIAAEDIEYNYPFGFKELEGIHNRGDYDLKQHSKCSGEKLTYFDQETNEHIIPNVIETSIGVGRLFMAILFDAYCNEKLEDGTERVVLKIKPSIAPIKAAILPLVRKDGLPEKAKEVYNLVSKNLSAYYDETGTVGKRYRRADEIGTPFGITIDYDSMNDNSVTIRDRDSMKQDRVHIDEVVSYITEKIR